MSRSTYAPRHDYVGNGVTDEFEFDFKIEALTQLLVLVYDDENTLVESVRGDDVTFIGSVDFDAVEGGGTITLADPLTDDYQLIILEANDAPTQPAIFRNQGQFTLRLFELALDRVVGAVQRLAYRAARAMEMHPLQDTADLSLEFPLVVPASDGGKVIAMNDDGDGLELGPTTASIFTASADAVAAAAAASASETAAAASASSASASAGAAATSATSASASAAAAAASAASVGVPSVMGSRAAPTLITAAGIAFVGAAVMNIWFVAGNGGAIDITANPQIAAGTVVGQRLLLIGCDDTNTIKFENGTGLVLKEGSTEAYLFASSSMEFVWDGTTWTQVN